MKMPKAICISLSLCAALALCACGGMGAGMQTTPAAIATPLPNQASPQNGSAQGDDSFVPGFSNDAQQGEGQTGNSAQTDNPPASGGSSGWSRFR